MHWAIDYKWPFNVISINDIIHLVNRKDVTPDWSRIAAWMHEYSIFADTLTVLFLYLHEHGLIDLPTGLQREIGDCKKTTGPNQSLHPALAADDVSHDRPSQGGLGHYPRKCPGYLADLARATTQVAATAGGPVTHPVSPHQGKIAARFRAGPYPYPAATERLIGGLVRSATTVSRELRNGVGSQFRLTARPQGVAWAAIVDILREMSTICGSKRE